MQDNETETLADRLNQEPVIFRGSTNSELGIILLCAVVFWVPFGFIVGALFGAVVMGLGISSLGVLITIVVGSTVFQRIKRGKPDNYYQHQVIIKLDRLKLRKSSLILSSGNWDLGRTELNKMNQSTP
jgi:conjugative transfer region protein (TIGR03750 family)